MKNNILFYIMTCTLIISGCSNVPRLTLKWSSLHDLRVPESVMYDKQQQILYISNINGKPTEKNKKGFISKVSLSGKVEKLQWITGCNAPKGMGLIRNTLYVTDIDRLHKIDCTRGIIAKTYAIKGAKFLNDIAIDAQNRVYISDMGTNKIHILENDRIETWLELQTYSRPNGLYMRDNMLYIGTAEGLLKVNTTSKQITMAYPLEGGIDGVKAYSSNSFIVTDWKGTTRLLREGKNPLVLLDTSKEKIQAADFEYIPDKKILIIPTFFDNRIMTYNVE